jgi:hypothetical protein
LRKKRPPTPRKRAEVRADKRGEVLKRQASQALTIDDMEHGDAEVPIHLLSRGKVLRRFVQCGRDNCHCRTGGRRHGPYHYLVINIPAEMRRPGQPKQKWFYLTEEEAERFRARINNYKVLVKNMFADLWDELHVS